MESGNNHMYIVLNQGVTTLHMSSLKINCFPSFALC